MFSRSTAIDQLRALIAQPKTIDEWPTWTPVNRGLDARISFVSGLSINGVGIAGLFVRGTASQYLIAEDIVFQLEAVIGHKPRPICRIEFKPISGHRNPRDRRDFISQIDGGVSHHHVFEANAHRGLSSFESDNLPLAVPLEPPPSSINEFMGIVASSFGIPDLVGIDWPEWQGRMQI